MQRFEIMPPAMGLDSVQQRQSSGNALGRALSNFFDRLKRWSRWEFWPPYLFYPPVVAYIAGVVSTAWAEVTGREPRAPIEAVRMARKHMFVSHAKAERELNFKPVAAEGALARAAGWFRENGYC